MLIALNSPKLRRKFQESAAELGIPVDFCRSAVEAIAVFKAGRYDHVVLDHDLFPVGGFDAAKLMLEINHNLRVTIIMPNRPVDIRINENTFALATPETSLADLVQNQEAAHAI